MPIRNDQERKRCMDQIFAWNGMKRRVGCMSREWSIDDSQLIALCEKKLTELSIELEEYDSGMLQIDADAARREPFELLGQLIHLPDSLIETRVILGWKQTDLAVAAQITVPQLCRYERNKYSNITFSTVLKLANVLTEEWGRRSKAN